MAQSGAGGNGDDGLFDASLGSLPTLIVPDDPVNGAIEKPKTPPASPRRLEPEPVVAPKSTSQQTHLAASVSPGVPPMPPTSQINNLPPLSSRPEATVTAQDAKAPAPGSARDPPVVSAAASPSATVDATASASPRPVVTGASPRAVDALQLEVDLQPSVNPTADEAVALLNETTPVSAITTAAPATTTTAVSLPGLAPQPSSVLAPKIDSKDFYAMSKRAIALAKLDRLAGGNKSVFDADMADIGALGIGMQLYFMLTKYLGVTFLFMGIVSLPAIIVNLSGNGVNENMIDPLQMAYSSLGNQGVNPDTMTDQDLCLPKGYIDCNWTTVDTPFTTDPVTVSWIITICDVLYSFGFLLFYLFYRHQARRAIDAHMNENLTPAKYAVFVKGLPPDATEKEILEHFNTRYDLTKDEEYHPLWFACCWGRRRKVKTSLSRNAVNRNTVQNLDHLACTTSITKELYLNTWIAEVSIGHPTGGLLKTFLSMEALTRKISETQELIQILEEEKKTAPSTGKKAFKPSDEKLLQEAIKTLATLNIKLEAKTSKIKALKRGKTTSGVSTKSTREDLGTAVKPGKRLNAVKKASVTQKAFDWEATECAFVVFNNIESRRRCLQDYRSSGRWITRKFQPKNLRFRSDKKYPLIVRPAPEPSNILWENLEVTDRGRFYRRSLTNLITFLLLLLSCGIISGAQSAQQEMKKKMVTAGFCDYTLPMVFYGNDSFYDNSRIKWNLQWDANKTCDGSVSGKPRYHIAYGNGIVNNLNITRAAKTYATSRRCTDPCISETSNTTCNTIPCFDQNLIDEGEVCETYQETNILFCLCKEAVSESIKSYGLFQGPQKLWKEVTPCRGFITDYVSRNVFMYVAAGIVVIVNMLLKAILRAFATFEAHSSESAKASAIAIKMFGAQFLNTAIIVLVVNAALNLQGFPLLGDLFQGKYSDFERDWYPTVGMGITMTMLINAFVPQIVLFIQMFLVGPVMRRIQRRKLRTQDQMNKLYAGPAFDISVRYPLVLNSLFVTMMFCGGSPVLLFIASLTAFGTFWFDKLSIIHLYSVKTAYDEDLGETALSVLPWTLALHLSFSTWMYGNKSLMKATTIDLKLVLDLLNVDVVDANNTIITANQLYDEFYQQASKFDPLGEHGLVVKIVRTNAMVVFLFFALLVVALLLSTVVLQLLWPIVRRTLGVILHALWRKIKQKYHDAKLRRKNRAKATAKVHVDNKPLESAPVAAASDDKPPAPAVEPPPLTTMPVVASAESTPAPEQPVNPPVDTPPTEAPPTEAPSVAAASGLSPSSVVPLPLPTTTSQTSAIATKPASARQPSSRSSEVVIPEFTDYFRKTVPRRFSPDKKLGFQKNDKGELVRVWQEETVQYGIKRSAGERMLTWEAMQAPVKSYAIEANSKYRLAVAEIVAAAKRLKTAATLAAVVTPAPEEPVPITTVNQEGGVDAAIVATEPITAAAPLAGTPRVEATKTPRAEPVEATATAAPASAEALLVPAAGAQDASSETVVQVTIPSEQKVS